MGGYIQSGLPTLENIWNTAILQTNGNIKGFLTVFSTHLTVDMLKKDHQKPSPLSFFGKFSEKCFGSAL